MKTFKKSLSLGFGKGFVRGIIIASLFSFWALITTTLPHHYPNPGLYFFASLIFFTFINTIILGVIFTAKEMGSGTVRENTEDFVSEEEI